MKGLSKNAKIGIIIILIIIILVIIAINPTGQYTTPPPATQGPYGGGGGGTVEYDMAVSDISWYPANPNNGTNVAVSGQIANWGTRTIPSGKKVEFYLWYDGAPQPGKNYTLNHTMAIDETINVFLDNQVFTSGNHQIRVKIKPYFTDTNSSNNERIETIVVSGQQPQTGNLNVTSTPTNASIYVDSSYRGNTPIFISSLSAGTHSVRATKTGYIDYITNVTIIAGQTTNLNIVLIPSGNQTDNPPTVNVTHYFTPVGNQTNVTILAQATDDIDITNVKIYMDSILRRTCTFSGAHDYSVECLYTSIRTGTHSYYASATDSGSHTTTTQTYNFTIP